MPSNVPPVRNSSFSFTCRLADQANAGKWKSSPTLATGDVKIRKDGGSANNITTLPTASGTQVTVTLTATEMDADEVVVEFIDAAGNEWGDLAIPIYTVARRIDDLAFPATSGRSMAVDASGNVAADAKLLNGSSTPITNLNTVFNTDFASNYNTTADRWKVDLTHVNGTASTSSGGYLEVDTTKWGGIAVGLAVIQVDLETIMGQSITCAAPVTVGAYVGGTAAAATQTSVDDLPTNSEMQAMIDALNQSAARRTMLATSLQWEIPESGSNTFKIQLRTYDGDGALTNADSTPTLTATGQVSGSLAANLSSATNPSTGIYVWTYTLASGSTSEQVQLDASATIGGTAFTASSFPVIADFVAATFTTSDRTKIEAVYNKLPSKNYLAGTNNSDGDIQINEATGTPADSAAATNTYNIVNHADYGNQAIKDAVVPPSTVAGSFTQTYGSVISGTYANTATDDSNRHVLAPQAVNGLDAYYTFTIPTSNKPTTLAINGYFNGSGQFADLFAWDYEAAVPAWVQLSNSTTRMNSRTSDANYSYTLSRQYVDSATGEVKIRTFSASTNTAHRFHADRILVYSVSEAASISAPTVENIRIEIDNNSTQLASIKTDTGNLVTRITSTLFSGITSLANWLGAIAGKTADTTTRAEINATTAGAGYNETTDSLEAQKDSGFSLTEERKTVWENWLDYMPITTGTVASDAGNTALSFKTNLTTANGHSDYSGKIVMFKADCPTTSNQLQARRIIKDGHNLTTGVITVDTAFTAVPTAGDPFGIAGYQSSTA